MYTYLRISAKLLTIVSLLGGHCCCAPNYNDMDTTTRNANIAPDNIPKNIPLTNKPKVKEVTVAQALPDTLIDCVKDKTLQERLYALKKDPSQIDAVGADSHTLLQLAAFRGEFDVLKALLTIGADPNLVHNFMTDESVLSYVTRISHNPIGVIKALINNGANIKYSDPQNGDTALHNIVRWDKSQVNTNKQREAILCLLEGASDSGILLSLCNKEGKTPSAIAREKNLDASIITLLTPKQEDLTQTIPIEQELSNEFVGQLKDHILRDMLINLKKDPTKLETVYEGRLPLTHAIENNLSTDLDQARVVCALLNLGADPNFGRSRHDNSGHANALHRVLHKKPSQGTREIVKALIESKKININQRYLGRTPLHQAVDYLNLSDAYSNRDTIKEIIELLAQQPGVKLEQQDYSNKTPLAIVKAAKGNNNDIIQILEKSGART